MAGRGAIPVVLSPDYVEAIRYRYVETDQPVREICAESEISVGKLNRLIVEHGWPKRSERPPREMPAAVRLREEARRLAAGVPSPLAPSCPGSTRASTSFDQPASKTWMAGSSPAMTPEPAATADTISEDPVTRLTALVLREIAAEEAVRAQLGRAPRERTEAERCARTLSIHTQTLQNLERLRAAQMGAACATGRDHTDDDDDDFPADLDQFRLALAKRIEAFAASQPDDDDIAQDYAAGTGAAQS